MREIKFRVWDIDHDCMTNDVGIDKIYLFSFKGDNITEQEGLVIMQYAGVKDKNGKEIYEGDIVKQEYATGVRSSDGYDDWETFTGHHIGAVAITASAGVCLRNPSCYRAEDDETVQTNQYKRVAGYRCEIIGNIYTNPELLT